MVKTLPCKVIGEKLYWSRDHPFFQIICSTDLGLGFWGANGIGPCYGLGLDQCSDGLGLSMGNGSSKHPGSLKN